MRTPRRTTWPLMVVVFVAGMTTMAVEMAASRLLGPYFGDSILVWASLIGLILIYLSVGSALGGRWADRSPRLETLYTLTAVAAFWVGILPLIATPILRVAQNAFAHLGVDLIAFDAIQIGGSFLSVLVLLAPPIVLLGAVSPFAIRLSTKQIRTAGSSAGRIYALSTVGSILGTFAPVLILIPALGTARTFLAFAALLFLASILGLAKQKATRRAVAGLLLLLLLAVLSLLFGPRIVKVDAHAIHERESRYNYIQVLEIDETRYLMLNEGQGVHSVYNPHTLQTFGTWDMFVVAPMFNPPPYDPREVQRVCVIGLAGGTVARQATEAYGPVPIDGVEVDPDVVEVGREFFHMDLPNLNVFVTDGRFFLQHSDALYDLVVLDAYRLPYIPFQLATSEFFALVADHLTPQGTIAVNVGRTDTDYRMVEAIAAALGQHLASVHAIDVPETFNTVLVATRQETDAANLQTNLDRASSPFLRDAMLRAIASMEAGGDRRGPAYDGPVFTDDRAPVEALTNAIVLRYLLRGE